MRVPVRNMAGDTVEEVDLRDDVFGIEPNEAVMHQALVRQLANGRLGTQKAKTRSEVSGGGRKPLRQKGTGRARQGSTRAPHWRGGGVVFAPTPRSYAQKMNRKMRRLGVAFGALHQGGWLAGGGDGQARRWPNPGRGRWRRSSGD